MSNAALNDRLIELLRRAHTQYRALGGDESKFYNFVRAIEANHVLVNRLNSIPTDDLQKIDIAANAPAPAYYSAADGRLVLRLDAVHQPHPDRALFIFAHEVAHAYFKSTHAIEYNAARAAAAASLSASGPIVNVNAHIVELRNASLREEARAIMLAWNDYLTGKNRGATSLDAMLTRDWTGTLVNPDGTIKAELQPNGHLFSMTDQAVNTAALRLGSSWWGPTSSSSALMELCNLAPGKILELDSTLLVPSGWSVSFDQIMSELIKRPFTLEQGICVIRDSGSGRTIEVRSEGGRQEIHRIDEVTGERTQLVSLGGKGESAYLDSFEAGATAWIAPNGDIEAVNISKGPYFTTINLADAPDEEIFAFLSKTVDAMLKEVSADLDRRALKPGPVLDLEPNADGSTNVIVALPSGIRRSIWGHSDQQGRSVSLKWQAGRVEQSLARDGKLTVEKIYSSSGNVSATRIRIEDSPVGIDFAQAGEIIGQQLGSFLARGDKISAVLASGFLQTVGENLGGALNLLTKNPSVGAALKESFEPFGAELVANIKGAGIGAVSSYLTAQLIGALGVSGFAGELANTAGGTILNTLLFNIAGLNGADLLSKPFSNIGLANVPTAVASFLGSKLASEIVSFDTVGGQLGSSIGSSLGSIGGIAAAKHLAFLGTSLAGPVGAAVGAFLGFIAGGLIGSAFGGTPRSGADVVWDAQIGQFAAGNGWARKGGSMDAALSMATAVAETYNNVVALTGGTLLDPQAVQAGNYGMRKKDYVYRPVSSEDKDTIVQRFTGPDGAAKLIGYGLYQGLSDPDFRIAGGDVLAKRALYNTFQMGGVDALNFDPAIVLGNIAVAQRYQTYLMNSTSINALIAAEPDSVFTAEWAVTFARAVELGLTRRHESDWYGGFGLLMHEAGVTAAQGSFGKGMDMEGSYAMAA